MCDLNILGTRIGALVLLF
jgi:hypothetical protein